MRCTDGSVEFRKKKRRNRKKILDSRDIYLKFYHLVQFLFSKIHPSEDLLYLFISKEHPVHVAIMVCA